MRIGFLAGIAMGAVGSMLVLSSPVAKKAVKKMWTKAT
jgi:hypothetical protein